MEFKPFFGVSIVIPTYNRDRFLDRTLQSLRSLRIPNAVEIEVLVIDNNCTDETAGVVEQAARDSIFAVRRIVEMQQGVCNGRNRGLKEARYEHLAFLDDDLEVSQDWVSGYVEAVERMAADCVVGPVFPLFECEPPDYLTEPVLDSVTSAYSRKGQFLQPLPGTTAHELPGCNFGVRKSKAVELGGFRIDLDRNGAGLLAGGDTEFGVRAVKAGLRVVYQPRCAVSHFISKTKMSPQHLRDRWSGLGQTERILENRPTLSVWRVLRYAAGLAKLFGVSMTQYCLGDVGAAFQRELEFRRGWGYLKAYGLPGGWMVSGIQAFLTLTSGLR